MTKGDGVRLDAAQHAAVTSAAALTRVIGASGTGRTTVAVEALAHQVAAGMPADRVVLLAPTRVEAGRLRPIASARLGVPTTRPLVRTPASLAFAIVTYARALRAEGPPRLLTGADQDVVLGDLLAGHASGLVPAPGWPAELSTAVTTAGFRSELRELGMRMVERGLSPAQLAELGDRIGMPVWRPAARVLEEYDEVTALSRPGFYDPAWLLAAAVDELADDDVADVVSQAVGVIVVDDAQELTAPAARLVEAMLRMGTKVVLVGDPDATVQGFRGADPRLMLAIGADVPGISDSLPLLGGGLEEVVLRTAYARSERVQDLVDTVAARIGAAGGVAHRAPRPLTAVPEGDTSGSGRGSASDSHPPSGGSDDTAGSDGDDQARVPAGRGRVLTHVAPSDVAQARAVAGYLRTAHLLHGVPWAELAVITRGRSGVDLLTRELEVTGVPVQTGQRRPVREIPVARALLDVLALAGGFVAEAEDAGDQDSVVERVLRSPLGGLDGFALRDIRRRGLAAGVDLTALIASPEDVSPASPRSAAAPRSPRSPGATVDQAEDVDVRGFGGSVSGPGATPVTAGFRVPPAVQRIAASVRAARAAMADEESVPAVLWAAWSALGVAQAWQSEALRGGESGRRHDDLLDGVIALFGAAEAFEEALPGRDVTAFVAHVLARDVAADSLVPSGGHDAVVVTTPAGAAGRRWECVVLVGLQEGQWPNLRLRGSLLGSQLLVDLLSGRLGADIDMAIAGGGASTPSGVQRQEDAARRAVLDDELRMLHAAVSRARREVLVTAVAGLETQPSSFFDLVAGVGEALSDADGAAGAGSLTLPGVVAELRRALVEGMPPEREPAYAAALRALAAAGVEGADPDGWWHAGTPDSVTEPPMGEVHPAGELPVAVGGPASDVASASHAFPVSPTDPTHQEAFATSRPVRVSPSRVEAVLRCPLAWFLDTVEGGDGRRGFASDVGILVHDIAATVEDNDLEVMLAELDRRWHELPAPPGWLGEREKERGREMIRRLHTQTAKAQQAGWSIVGRELPLDVEVAAIGDDDATRRVRLVGRVDRLERNDTGQLRVVDLKTGTSKPTKDEIARHPQLGTYQAAVDAGAFEVSDSGGAALLHVGRGSVSGTTLVQPALADDEDPQWAHRMLGHAADLMTAESYPATPGPGCRMCSHRSACPAQPEGRRW